MISPDFFGYLAMGLNLLSMTMTAMHRLRTVALLANLIFAYYGYLIGATPVTLAASLAALLHAYKLARAPRMQQEG